jgi:hypothetical protein
VKNSFEVRGSETVIFLKYKDSTLVTTIDTADLPRVREFPGTWGATRLPPGLFHVQTKQFDSTTGRSRSISLPRWIVEADDDTLVRHAGDPLDNRRSRLIVSAKRRSWTRQLERRRTETERLQYAKALAQRVAQETPFPAAEILRRIQRQELAELGSETEYLASRLAGERSSLPPLRVRSGWEHRVPSILEALHASDREFIGRADVERVFQVSRMTAVRILDRFGARRAGNALVVSRQELVDRLAAVERDPEITWERERHQRIVSAVAVDRQSPKNAIERSVQQLARELQGDRKVVEGSAQARRYTATRFEDLPPGVQLGPSRLTIEFTGFQDLLVKFGAVLFALQNTPDQIERFVER